MNIRADCMLDILFLLDSMIGAPKEGEPSNEDGVKNKTSINSGAILGNEELNSKFNQYVFISLYLLITMQLINATKNADVKGPPEWEIHGITPRGRSYMTTKVFS